MNAENIVLLAVAAIGALGSCAAAWIAKRAERNTKPLGNGFAPETTSRLDRIENLLMEHIQAHADANVRGRPR